MNAFAAETLIKLTQHYEQLLSKQKADLEKEKKKVDMYESMVGRHSDIYDEKQPGDCVVCGVLCYSVKRAVIDNETEDEIDFYDQYNYEVCNECNELTCNDCHQHKLGLVYSLPWERELNKCTKCTT